MSVVSKVYCAFSLPGSGLAIDLALWLLNVWEA